MRIDYHVVCPFSKTISSCIYNSIIGSLYFLWYSVNAWGYAFNVETLHMLQNQAIKMWLLDFMSPNLVLYSDWCCGIVLDDVVFKRVWSTSLIAVSIETPCNHFGKKDTIWKRSLWWFWLWGLWKLISEDNFPKLQQSWHYSILYMSSVLFLLPTL